MPRKKTNYEKKGFVRQIAGSIFSPQKGSRSASEGKWRPRKNQFERLDGPEEELDRTSINKAFSTESETGEYRRQIMFERKKAAFKQVSQKRDLGSITLKPSARDNGTSRKSTGSRQKKQRMSNKTSGTDCVVSDAFDVGENGCDESIDDTLSRQTASTKQTASTRQSAFNTVRSDPSELFSNPPNQLTHNNLELMAAMSADITQNFSGDGIENINPRSKFYQFSIDEDKESTVILPVGYQEDESVPYSEDDYYDEETDESIGFTSMGTRIQKRSPRLEDLTERTRVSQPKKKCTYLVSDLDSGKDSTAFFLPVDEQPKSNHHFFPEFDSKNDFPESSPVSDSCFFPSPKTKQTVNIDHTASNRTPSILAPPQRRPSSHSLAYSPSPTDANWKNRIQQSVPQAPRTPPRMKTNVIMRPHSQPRPSRDRRLPLSPLNVMKPPNSTSKVSSMKKCKPDPDAGWPQLSTAVFEKKPDPKGDDFKLMKTGFAKEQVSPFESTALAFNTSSMDDPFEDKDGVFGISCDPVDPFDLQASSFSSNRETGKHVDQNAPPAAIALDPFAAHASSFASSTKEVDPSGCNDITTAFESPTGQVDQFLPDNKGAKPITSTISRDSMDNSIQSTEHDKEEQMKFDSFSPNAKPRRPHHEKRTFSPRRPVWSPKPVPEHEVFEDDITEEEQDIFEPRGNWSRKAERPIGIQSFPTEAIRGSSSESTKGSQHSRPKGLQHSRPKGSQHSRSTKHDQPLCSYGRPKSMCSHVEDELDFNDDEESLQSSAASYSKPLGVPNNAIMASMLFRTHHNVDTRAVEAKLKAKDVENSKFETNRGDVPQAIHAFEDTYSCVSSFSEDTAMVESRNRPTKDLLEYFSTSRRTDFDAQKYLREQRAQATALFEA